MTSVVDWDNPVGYGVKDLYCTERAVRLKSMKFRDYVKLVKVDLYNIGYELHSIVKLKNCEKEVPIEFEGKRFRADAVCQDERGKYVVEVKSTLNRGLIDMYRFQLRAYMALLGIPRGVLIGLMDNRVEWHVMGEREMEEVREDLRKRIREVENNIGEKNIGEHCRYCIFYRDCLNRKLI